MKRRQLLLGSLLGAATLHSAQARTICGPAYCSAEVDFFQFAQSAYQNQEMSEWCWAACISMVFAYNGHPVSQERIVSEAYGIIDNVPAISGIVISQSLNREWVDDDGNHFRSHLTGVVDLQAGVATLNNNLLLSTLNRNQPIIIGAGSHAMVLTQLSFVNTMYGPSIIGGGVFDPWPGRGARNASPAELVPVFRGGALFFIATMSVTDI